MQRVRSNSIFRAIMRLIILVICYFAWSCDAYCDVTFAIGQCTFFCQDVGWQDGLHPGHEMLANVVDNNRKCPGATEFTMYFKNCSFPNGKLDADWFMDVREIYFQNLQFSQCNLNAVEDGALSNFNNYMGSFTVESSPEFTSLTAGMLSGAPSPEFYGFGWINNSVIEHLDAKLFHKFLPSLKSLHMSDGTGFLNMEILANMSGQCQTSLASQINSIHLNNLAPGYGIPVLSNKLFSAITPTSSIYVDLSNAGIEAFEYNTALDSFTRGLSEPSAISLQNNQLRNIPDGSFETLINADVETTINLAGNPWHCDCNLQYVQDVFTSASNKLTLDVASSTLCASPLSQAGVPILEADMQISSCVQPLPTPPPLSIQCYK